MPSVYETRQLKKDFESLAEAEPRLKEMYTWAREKFWELQELETQEENRRREDEIDQTDPDDYESNGGSAALFTAKHRASAELKRKLEFIVGENRKGKPEDSYRLSSPSGWDTAVRYLEEAMGVGDI